MVHAARGWSGPAMLIVSLVITLLVYVARMRAKYGIAKNAGIDDVFISVAILPLIGLTLSIILALSVYGYQLEADELTPYWDLKMRKIKFVALINYLVATMMIKLSILCFCRRLTGTLSRTFVHLIWGNIIFCMMFSLSCLVNMMFICRPISAYFQMWDKLMKPPDTVTCSSHIGIFIVPAFISCLHDIVICMLPAFLVWHLQMSQRQKIGICGILGLGLLTSVCGSIRAYEAIHSRFTTIPEMRGAYWAWFWTAVEVQLGVICASAPAMKIFFNRYFETNTPRIGSSKAFQRAKMRFLYSTQPRPSVQQTGEIVTRYSHEDIPLGSIRISHRLEVCNMPRTNTSPSIFAGTSSLAALPVIYASPLPSPSQNTWRES